jgi:hypothetical protein
VGGRTAGREPVRAPAQQSGGHGVRLRRRRTSRRLGGGLALYDEHGTLLGGVGVSGDTSCADHNVAWRVRHALGLDHVPGGVGPDATRPDNINYVGLVPVPSLAHDFSHPVCAIAGVDGVSPISAALPAIPAAQ